MLAPGTQIGGYRIEAPLGRGGMGAVYEATQLSLGRTVALKLLEPTLGADPDFRDRFRREGRVQAALEHPHIVTVHDFGELPEGLFIAMRLVRGSDLKSLIRAGELDPQRTLRILRQVAEALDAAHEAGLMHRDIKPQNILIGARDHAYLADFGLTKAKDDEAYTKTGQFLGTLDYVAPEQIQGEASRFSDIYALACVAYECLTGKVPFPRPTEAAIVFAHMCDEPPHATELAPQLGRAVDEVLITGMAKDAADRPSDATTLVDRLARALEVAAEPAREAGQETRTSPPREVPRREPVSETLPGPRLPAPEPEPEPEPNREPQPTRRRIPLVLVGAALVAGAAGGVAVAGVGSGDSDTPSAGRTVAGSGLSLRLPSGWTEAPVPRIDGLDLSGAVAARPPQGAGTVVAGRTTGTGPSFLPASFVSRLPDEPKRSDVVRLGRLTGLRYRDVRPKGGNRPLTLFVVPGERDVTTVACVQMPAAAACDAAAAGLALRDGREPTALSARSRYSQALQALLDRLARDRKAPLRRLASAKTPAKQADAARAVAAAYGRAATAAGRIPLTALERGVHRDVLAALRSARDGWQALASAAAGKKPAAYEQARSRTRERERALRTALGALTQLGYRLT